MKVKLLLIFIITLTCNTSNGQVVMSELVVDNKVELTDVLTEFISWISKIDSILIKIDDKEKLKRIYRKLGRASYDIDIISLEKEDLADKLNIIEKITEKEIIELQPSVSIIVIHVTDLNGALWDIKYELSSTEEAEVESIIYNASISSNRNKILQLDDIKGFLYGYDDNPLSKLKETVEESSQLSQNLRSKIREAKNKIKSKINKI